MQRLSGSVGDGGRNTACDVALVQVALMKIARPNNRGAYLNSYDGACGAGTIAAIRDFIADHSLAPPARPGGAAAALITVGSTAEQRLGSALPQAVSDLRCLAAGKTVFVAATAQDRDAALQAAARITFAPLFRTKVNAYINQMFALHGIASAVAADGGRRNFQRQYELFTSGRNVTNAGPGESNHNFGYGADVGYTGLRWIRANGDIVANEDAWLHRLAAVSAAEANHFWDTLRAVGTSNAVGAYPSNKAGDRPHLQNWSDNGTSMTRSLAGHLTRSGVMQWSRGQGTYLSDLGYGGQQIPVGTAAQIWAGQATVTAASITRARAAARPLMPVDARGNQRMPVAAGGGMRQPVPTVPGRAQPAAVTQQDVAAMQQRLRAEFESADRNWVAWRP